MKGVANRNEAQQVTNHWIVVTGFAKNDDGSPGPAEICGNIKNLDIIGELTLPCGEEGEEMGRDDVG